MRSVTWIFIVICTLVIVYLSWISSPRLGWNQLVPNAIAHWADKEENYNLRTAIPFICSGFASGILLIINKAPKSWWLGAWIVQVLLVILVEFGQLFRPLRSFDWMDIFWGMTGSGLTLLIIWCISNLLKKHN